MHFIVRKASEVVYKEKKTYSNDGSDYNLKLTYSDLYNSLVVLVNLSWPLRRLSPMGILRKTRLWSICRLILSAGGSTWTHSSSSSWQLPALAPLGQAHVQCHGKASLPWSLPTALRLEVEKDRCSFRFVLALMYAQLTSNHWSGWTSGSTLDAEKIAFHELLHHPHNKPYNKPVTLCHASCFSFSVELWLIQIFS